MRKKISGYVSAKFAQPTHEVYFLNVNYDRIYMQTVESFGGEKKNLLLHCCCAPCAVSALERLVDYFSVTLYFFNPNIDTEEEYLKRAEELEKLRRLYAIENIIIPEYLPQVFLNASKGLENEPEGGKRCRECFYLRLLSTAEKAEDGGFDYFGTTLSVSPHKNSFIVNEAGMAAQSRTGAKFLYSDFKKRDGYKRSGVLSETLGLYRQNYCGCGFAKQCR